MTTPTPVHDKGWEVVGKYLAMIFLGIPALIILVLIQLSPVDLLCNCVPFGIFPDWAPESRTLSGIITLIPILLADWFVWTRWRSYRREKKWAAAYTAEHLPSYARPDQGQKQVRSEDDK